MWDLIITVPDHCLSFLLYRQKSFLNNLLLSNNRNSKSVKLEVLPSVWHLHNKPAPNVTK